MNPLDRRSTRIVWGILLAALTVFAVLVLPFFFPPATPSRSQAYAAGANNRVAEIAVGVLSLIAGLVALRFSRTACSSKPAAPLPWRFLWWGVAGMSACTLLLGALMVRANVFYGEAEYFLTQLDKGLKLGGNLYRTIQFAYGPVLYGWPMLCIRGLHPFGIGTMPAYVGALIVTQAAGVGLLFYTIRALPMRRGLQGFAFVTLAIGSISPTMGFNYSLFRFVVPIAFAVLLSTSRGLLRATLIAALGTLAGFAVSSEAGIACLGAVIASAVARCVQDRSRSRLRWLALMPAAGVGAALLLFVTGREYLQTVSEAGTGAYDLLLTPEPRVLLVLISVVGLAPLAVARALRHNDGGSDSSGPLLACLYGSALGQMPVALGRCDAEHTFFFSLGAILLSLVAIDRGLAAHSRFAQLWVVAIVLWVLMTQHGNASVYQPEIAGLIEQARHPDTSSFDVKALERQLDGQSVFLTDDASWAASEELLDRRQIAPNFFCQEDGIWRAPAERRKITEMRAADFALVPAGGLAAPMPFAVGAVKRWQRFGLAYRERLAPFVLGRLMDEELARNWTPVAVISGETLYRRLR